MLLHAADPELIVGFAAAFSPLLCRRCCVAAAVSLLLLCYCCYATAVMTNRLGRGIDRSIRRFRCCSFAAAAVAAAI